MIGCVGDDDFADEALVGLREAGVVARPVKRTAEARPASR